MSATREYPPIRYRAAEGEASAWIRRAAAAPDLVNPNGTTVEYLATGASTDGLFGLYRYSMGAGPGGPGPHFHRTMTESFVVLEGHLTIFDGRGWAALDPGDFAHVPAGGIHGFRNESGAPVSFLIHFAPGAPREGYFEGTVRFAVEGRPSPEELAEFYRVHDNTWLDDG